MRLFRRRRPDPALVAARRGFGRVAVHVDAAQRALLAAVPTARDDGVPLAQALAAFAERLDAAERDMPGWKDDRMNHEWTMCLEALADARLEAERLRLETRELGFEALNARIGDVLHPLETFAETERSLRRR